MKKVFEITSLLAAAVLITGCANFLKGADTKAEIEKSIDYANSPYISVSIGSEYEETKTIIPAAGEYIKDYKKGDSFNISFTPKDEYKFLEWMCAPEGAVEFEDKTERSTAAIIKLASGSLKIFPKNALYPDISSFYPPMEQAGFPQDTTIEIKFNKTVDLDYFKDFNHIAITSDEISLVKYFQAPVIVNETTLEIRTLKDKNIIPLDSEITSQDVTVEIDLSELTDNVSGENLGFREKNQTFVYKINPSKDKDAPKIVTPLTAQKALPAVWLEKRSAENIPLESFETYSKKDDLETVFEQHHVGAKIRLYTQFKDEGSGVKEFRIKEKLLKTKDSVAVLNGFEKMTVYKMSNTTTNEAVTYNADTKIYTYSDDYIFNCVDDGVIELTLEAEDYAGNVTLLTSEKNPLQVIKDTYKITFEMYMATNTFPSIDLKEYEMIITGQESGVNKDYYFKFNGNEFLKLKKIKSETEYSESVNKVMNLLYVSTDNVTWTEVGDENRKKGILKYTEDTGKEYAYPATLVKVKKEIEKDMYFKYVTIDSVGNEFEYNSSIQKTPDITGIKYIPGETGDKLELSFSEEPLTTYSVFIKENKQNSGLFALTYETASSKIAPCFGKNNTPGVLLPYKGYIKTDTDYQVYVLPTTNGAGAEISEYYTDADPEKGVSQTFINHPLKVLGCFNESSIKETSFFDAESNFTKGTIIYKTYLYGTFGKPLVFNTGNLDPESIPDEVVPGENQIMISELDPIPFVPDTDSERFQAVISYENGFTEKPGYYYFVRQYDSEDKSKLVMTYPSKNIKTKLKSSYFEVVVSDGKGNEKVSPLKSITFVGDIDPPVIKYNLKDYKDYSNFYTGTTDKVISSLNFHWRITSNKLYSIFYIDEDKENIKEVSYLLSNNEKLKLSDLNDSDFSACKLNKDKKIEIDLNGDDSSTVYVKIIDKAGNIFFDKKTFTRKVLNDFYGFSLTDNTLSVSAPEEYKLEQTSSNDYYADSIRFFAENINKKLIVENKAVFKKTNIALDLSDITAAENKTFVKIYSEVFNLKYKGTNTLETKLGYFPYVTYFCPYYEKNKDSVKCNLKNVIKGEMGLSIMCDQVAFAHTLYSTYNYGSDKESKDYAQWETRGYEAGDPVVCESSFSYEIPDVEKGYWYTTIVHFADGTVYQTEPVLK